MSRTNLDLSPMSLFMNCVTLDWLSVSPVKLECLL